MDVDVSPPPSSELTVAAVQAPLRFYPDEAQFREEMARWIEEAMQHAPDLIVLPEYVALGLVALGAPLTTHSRTLPQVIAAVALAHPIAAVRAMFSRSLSIPRALLLAVADRMRAVYTETFAELARAYGIYIAAGTVALPHVERENDAVYNIFFLFGPDGVIAGSADKINLIALEAEAGLDLAPGERDAPAVWTTPFATMGPLICYDAWDVTLARALVEQGAELLLVPSANPETWTADVLAARKEGLFARVRELGVAGVEAFAVGELAGLPFQGRSWILIPDANASEGVRIVAHADSPTRPQVIAATIELPARSLGFTNAQM